MTASFFSNCSAPASVNKTVTHITGWYLAPFLLGTIDAGFKLTVGNAVNLFPRILFLGLLCNLRTPVKGTWQGFLPRIAWLCFFLGFPLFVLFLGGFSKLIQPCLIAFPFPFLTILVPISNVAYLKRYGSQANGKWG